MAPEEPKRGRGRPPGKSDDPVVTFAVSRRLYEYLGWLQRNTLLGRTENDVARRVLGRRLEDMRQSNYHEDELTERPPPAERPTKESVDKDDD